MTNHINALMDSEPYAPKRKKQLNSLIADRPTFENAAASTPGLPAAHQQAVQAKVTEDERLNEQIIKGADSLAAEGNGNGGGENEDEEEGGGGGGGGYGAAGSDGEFSPKAATTEYNSVGTYDESVAPYNSLAGYEYSGEPNSSDEYLSDSNSLPSENSLFVGEDTISKDSIPQVKDPTFPNKYLDTGEFNKPSYAYRGTMGQNSKPYEFRYRGESNDDWRNRSAEQSKKIDSKETYNALTSPNPAFPAGDIAPESLSADSVNESDNALLTYKEKPKPFNSLNDQNRLERLQALDNPELKTLSQDTVRDKWRAWYSALDKMPESPEKQAIIDSEEGSQAFNYRWREIYDTPDEAHQAKRKAYHKEYGGNTYAGPAGSGPDTEPKELDYITRDEKGQRVYPFSPPMGSSFDWRQTGKNQERFMKKDETGKWVIDTEKTAKADFNDEVAYWKNFKKQMENDKSSKSKDTGQSKNALKFYEMLGHAANALAPNEFGGRLGRSAAGMAQRSQAELSQQEREERQAAREDARYARGADQRLATLTHTNLSNQKMQGELDPLSPMNVAKANRTNAIAEDLKVKEDRNTIASVDIERDPTGESHTRMVEALKKKGRDISDIPPLIAFKDSKTGEINTKDYKAWQINKISTADQKVLAARTPGNKDTFTTKTLYRKDNPEQTITIGVKTGKEGVLFDITKSQFKDNYTDVKPTATKSDPKLVQVVKDGKRIWVKSVDAVDQEAPSSKPSVGRPVVVMGSDGIPRWETQEKAVGQATYIKPEKEIRATPKQLSDAESTILLNQSSIIQGAQPKGVAPQAQFFNENTNGSHIYLPKTEDNRRYIGPWNVMGNEVHSWEKTTLPVKEGRQVTGKDIDRTAKANGVAYDNAYQGIVSDKIKPVWEGGKQPLIKSGGPSVTAPTVSNQIPSGAKFDPYTGKPITSNGTALNPPGTPPGPVSNPTIPATTSNPDRFEADTSKPSKADPNKTYDTNSILKAANAAVQAGATPQSAVQHAWDMYGVKLYFPKRIK